MGYCETCRWWQGQVSGRTYTPGRCYRYPPQMVVRERLEDLQQHRPMMDASDFCGEHSPRTARGEGE